MYSSIKYLIQINLIFPWSCYFIILVSFAQIVMENRANTIIGVTSIFVNVVFLYLEVFSFNVKLVPLFHFKLYLWTSILIHYISFNQIINKNTSCIYQVLLLDSWKYFVFLFMFIFCLFVIYWFNLLEIKSISQCS